jgi:hypothetical protein
LKGLESLSLPGWRTYTNLTFIIKHGQDFEV